MEADTAWTRAEEQLAGASPTVSDSDSGAETQAKKAPTKKRKVSNGSSKKTKKVKVSKKKLEDADDEEKVGMLICTCGSLGLCLTCVCHTVSQVLVHRRRSVGKR